MVTTASAKIRPGILVALSVRMSGGVTYRRKDIEKGVDENGSSHAKWETERVILDAVEHELAVKVRGSVRYTVAKACANTGFGLLCPTADESVLDEAIAEARKEAIEFNAGARTTKIDMFVLKGRIAATDREAAAAITAEVGALLGEMEQALKGADVEAIRDAANKAKSIGLMLDGDAGDAVSDAIKAARKVARQVVKRVEKGAEDAETVIREVSPEAFAAVNAARFALLDTVSGEDSSEVASDVLPSVDAGRFTGLDFTNDDSDEVLPPEPVAVEAAPEAPVVIEAPVEAPVVVEAPVEAPVVSRGLDIGDILDLPEPVLPTTVVGVPCPKCSTGSIIKGKAAWGCDQWKAGCDYRIPFMKNGVPVSEADAVRSIYLPNA